MNKKGKNKGISANFVVTPKTQNETNAITELQLRKKLLEEKLLITKKNSDDTKRKLLEKKERLQEIRNLRIRESQKYNAIGSDFKNQKGLVEMNYTDKINHLESVKTEKLEKIEKLKSQIEELETSFVNKMDQKNKLSQQIRLNMDDLSKFFSEKLSDIQKNLQDQIDKISTKWENNITEHLKKYEEHKLLNFLNEFNQTEITYTQMNNEVVKKKEESLEVSKKLSIENELLNHSINQKAEQIKELDTILFNKLPVEIKKLDYLMKKEQEILNKTVDEKDKEIEDLRTTSDELKFIIDKCKEISMLTIDKTSEGYLKLILYGLFKSDENKEAHIVVDVRDGMFRIIQISPYIDCEADIKQLEKDMNFTSFIVKVANHFLKKFN